MDTCGYTSARAIAGTNSTDPECFSTGQVSKEKKAMMLENYNLHAIARGTARVNVNWIVLKFISGLSFKTKSYQHGNE